MFSVPASDAVAIAHGSRTSTMSGRSPFSIRAFSSVGSISESSGIAPTISYCSGPRVVREQLDLFELRQHDHRHHHRESVAVAGLERREVRLLLQNLRRLLVVGHAHRQMI